MRRVVLIVLAALVASSTGTTAASAAPPRDRIALPDGFQPEGISIRPDGTFYVGSIPTGAIYAGDVGTSKGSILVEPRTGRMAVGLKFRHGKLFVAGGETGQAYVYDAHTGDDIAVYQLTEEGGFINDVVVTRRAAWFTDSVLPVLYKLPLHRNGDPAGDVEVVPYKGDIRYREGFNINGIEATPGGHKLVIVQSNTGLLFEVDPTTGATRRIEGVRARNGDGLLLEGRCLYAVQNFFNQIAVIELARDLSEGDMVEVLTDDDLDVPTTLDDHGGHLYVVNARFDTPPTPTTDYWVAVVQRSSCEG
jgi:hypothetical protein